MWRCFMQHLDDIPVFLDAYKTRYTCRLLCFSIAMLDTCAAVETTVVFAVHLAT